MSNYGYLQSNGHRIGGTATVVPSSIHRGQVYLATHDAKDNRLSNYERSYISFLWGGRRIEDFNLLVVSDGDRYDRNAYGEFEDLVTESDILDGQYYWGSHFTERTLSLNLATDGMSEKDLQDFRSWFRPGIARKLILVESPHKYIYARVKETPKLSLIPFKSAVETFVGRNKYFIDTVTWKGEITLEFVMDDPFWVNTTTCFFGDDLTQDNLRAILEDGIPHSSMFDLSVNEKILLPDMFVLDSTVLGRFILGQSCLGQYVTNTNFELDTSKDTNLIKSTRTVTTTEVVTTTTEIVNENTETGETTISSATVGPTTTTTVNIIDSPANKSQYYLYYPGTAPCRPTISFKFIPQWNGGEEIPQNESEVEDGVTKPPYIVFPANSFLPAASGYTITSYNYSELSIGSRTFSFTTPSILTSYNQLVKLLFETYSPGDSILDLKNSIREILNDTYARIWGLAICELALDSIWMSRLELTDSSGRLAQGFNTKFLDYFNNMFATDGEGNLIPFTCTFNSQNGTAKIEYSINILNMEEYFRRKLSLLCL